MKLSRLLATLALIAAGLAAPIPAFAGDSASAGDLVIERPPLRPDALRNVCTILTGAYRDERVRVVCEISDGAIFCDERCTYESTELRDLPPLQQTCELNRGTFRDIVVGQVACELKDGVITVVCDVEPEAQPWWFNRGELVAICDVRWIPSEQPMS